MQIKFKDIFFSSGFWITTLLLFCIFVPVYFISIRNTGDFITHAFFAIEMYNEGIKTITHFLYHVMFISIYLLVPDFNIRIISIIPAILSLVIIGLTIYTLLTAWFEKILPIWIRIFLSLSLLLIAPILVWVDNHMLLGYINFNAYHSPTQIILKLFVIPVSLIALRAIYPTKNDDQSIIPASIGLVFISAVLTILMTISKPNYVIVLVPTLGIYVIHHLLKKLTLDWRLLIFGIMFPALVVLSLQYLVTYVSDNQGIRFGVATFMRIFVDDAKIIPQYLLSIAFPLITYLLHFRVAQQDQYLNFSWVAFLIGSLYTYFLYETGPRMTDGNFLWSGYITLFILMFATMVFVIRHYSDMFTSWRKGERPSIPAPFLITMGIYCLHLFYGIQHYLFYWSLRTL